MEPTLKRKILDILSDYSWHSMASMVRQLNEATSISQRIGNMIRAGIVFERRHVKARCFEWRLISAVDQIDFERACLKGKPATCEGGSTKQNACASLLNKETGGRPVPLGHSGDLAGSLIFLPPKERAVTLITQDSKPTLPAPPLLQMEIAL